MYTNRTTQEINVEYNSILFRLGHARMQEITAGKTISELEAKLVANTFEKPEDREQTVFELGQALDMLDISQAAQPELSERLTVLRAEFQVQKGYEERKAAEEAKKNPPKIEAEGLPAVMHDTAPSDKAETGPSV